MTFSQDLAAFIERAKEVTRNEGFDLSLSPGDLGQGFQRFDRSGTLSGYYMLEAIGEGVLLHYGDFKTGEQGICKSDAVAKMDPKELERLKAKAWEYRLEMQEEAAKECETFWKACSPLQASFPYLIAKGLGGLPFMNLAMDSIPRLEYHAGTTVPMNMVIPLYNVKGRIVNLQRIDANGGKRFWPGAAIKESCAIIGASHDPSNPVVLCEGWATGATIHQATGLTVFCAMNAGNMRAVAETLLRDQSVAMVLICADNDWKHGAENPGEKAGLEAAAACGGQPILPRREDLGAKGSDFNDMAAVRGLDAVRDYILGGISKVESENGKAALGSYEGHSQSGRGNRTPDMGSEANSGGRVPPSLSSAVSAAISPRGKGPAKPSESAIAKTVAESLGDCLSVLGDLYRFVGTHWEMLDDVEVMGLRRKILYLSGGTFKSRDVESCLKAVHYFAGKTMGPEFYQPRPTVANFLDGTLEIIETGKAKGGYRLEFRPHRKEDYLTSVIPLEYKKARAVKPEANAMLTDMLERIFGECPDKAERIRAVKQMYGACLIPYFPRFFILHGPGGSGKSSLIILAIKLVSQKNCAMVDPQDFNGFNLESMIGKLINVVTDIDTMFSIKDGIVKKIEDRVPFLINRKFKRAIPAPLPAVHVFGANEIPRTMDGVSGAHTRRWSFVGLPHAMVAGQEYQRNFVELLWNAGPEAVLAFALEGLDDLVSSDGRFFNPESGVERLKEWQLESDHVGQFLADVRDGQFPRIQVDAAHEVSRAVMWEGFKMWFEDSHPGMRGMGKIHFFRRLRQKGIPEKAIKGVDYFSGYRSNTKEY